MNKWFGIGRLTSDPEITYAQNDKGTCIARYRLAVDRQFKKDGQQQTDFISCVAFGKNGEFAANYLSKGMKIAVEGRIQTGNYEKDGAKHYTTDIIVEHHEFCEKKSDAAPGTVKQQYSAPTAAQYGNNFDGGYDEMDDNEQLPF